MKKVLIISYYWPPSGGSGVQRWVKFSRYLPHEGWQPIVYTPENPELIAIDKTLEEEIPEIVEVIRRPILEPYGFYRKLTGKSSKEGATKGEVNPINAQKKSLMQKFSMFVRGNFFIPDPRCMWIHPSSKWLIKYLKDHPVDVIVSTGPPHSMHLIARKVAAKTGLPWIADFRDPWTKMFYFKHLKLCQWVRKRHEILEKKVLDDATAIVAVSPLVQAEFQTMTSTPIHLITNGYDEDDFAQDDNFEDSTLKFRITHTGLFASDGNPERLWDVLEDMCKENKEFAKALEIRLVGKTDKEITDSLAQKNLEENTVNLGYCDHRTAIKEQKGASLLILPLRKEPEYKATLPGKLFEYLASMRPILGIGQTDGAMASILKETSAGETYDWDDYKNIKSYITNKWKEFNAGKIKSKTHDIEKYSRRATAAQMAELMNKLSK